MKHIIILVLLLPVFCFSQNPSSIIGSALHKNYDSILNKDTIITRAFWALPDNSRNGLTGTPFYYDTIEVLLLVCDTTKYYKGNENGWYEIDPQTWWKPGYVVVERYSSWLGAAIRFKPLEPWFLDRRKQPLPKNIVVWMTKEVQ